MSTATAIAMSREWTPQGHTEAMRLFSEAAAPWYQMQSNILNIQPVRYWRFEDGEHFDREVLWDAKSKETFDNIAKVIDNLREEAFRCPR